MVERDVKALGIGVNGVQEGTDFFVNVDTSEIGKIFDEYRRTQMAIESLQKRLSELKPVLTDLVQNEEDESYIRDGYKAQIITTKPSKALKTKAEVLTAVPKKYHYQILKDKKGGSHLKVAVAPKENTVTVTITE